MNSFKKIPQEEVSNIYPDMYWLNQLSDESQSEFMTLTDVYLPEQLKRTLDSSLLTQTYGVPSVISTGIHTNWGLVNLHIHDGEDVILIRTVNGYVHY